MGNDADNTEEAAVQPAGLVRAAVYLPEQGKGNLLLTCSPFDEARDAVQWLVNTLRKRGFYISQPGWSVAGSYVIAALTLPPGFQHPELALINELRTMNELEPHTWSHLTHAAGVPDDTNQLDPKSGPAALLNRTIDWEILRGIWLAFRPDKPRPYPRRA